MKQLSQDGASMFFLEGKYKNTGGGGYWRKKFNQGRKSPDTGAPGDKFSLVENILKAYHKNSVSIEREDVFSMLAKLFVDLELIAYHSKTAPGTNRLKSTKRMMNYVHNVLIPLR